MIKHTACFKTLILVFFLTVGKLAIAQPIASFYLPSINANAGTLVFINSSANTTTNTTYLWTIMDSTNTIIDSSNAFNLAYTFTLNGAYSVELQIPNALGPGLPTLNIMGPVFITNAICHLNADFSTTVGLSPGAMNFSSVSTGTWGGLSGFFLPATSYLWDFGDGAIDSIASPVHTYSANGTYTVTLNVDNHYQTTCTSTVTKTVTVCNVLPIQPAFTYSVNYNGLVTYTSNSQNAPPNSNYLWYFSGANTSSTGINLIQSSFTYSSSVIDTVYLTITDNLTGCNAVVGQSVAVTYSTVPCNVINLVANFTYNTGSGGAVNFVSTSSGTNALTNYNWFFYGSNTSSVGTNLNQATVIYPYIGPYVVDLTITDSVNSCSATATQTVYATTGIPPCIMVQFASTVTANGTVSFSATPVGPVSVPINYAWNFGDNSTGIGANPVHTYTADGKYSVSVSASYSPNPCLVSLPANSFIYICNINPPLPGFASSINAGYTSSFSSTSINTGTATTYNWNFGDGGSGTGSSSVHSFSASGVYQVILTLGDSVNLACNEVTSQSVVISSTCTADASFTLLPTVTPQYWDAIPAFPSNVTAAEWNWGDGTTTESLYTSHLYSSAGAYNICLTVTISCGATNSVCTNYAIFRQMKTDQEKDMVRINVVSQLLPLGIKNTEAESVTYRIYPNPNNGEFELKISGLNSNPTRIAIYDLVGEKVYNQEIQALNGDLHRSLHLSSLSNGVYLIKINSGNAQKMVINK